MKRVISTTIVTLSCIALWQAGMFSPRSGRATAVLSAQSGRPAPVDWVTDGNDNQRTGWQRNETILTKKNVRNLKILWKI